MTIEEYKERRTLLEKELGALIGNKISEFERETGLSVEFIGVDVHYSCSLDGTPWGKDIHVSVDIPI